MNKRVLLFVSMIVLLALLLILSGCARTTPEPEAEAPKPLVRYVQFKVYDPVYVAVAKGFFEENGIQVDLIGDVLAGPTAIQAVSAGEAEAGLSSIPALINANAAGLPVQAVVDIQTTFENQHLQKWYVQKDAPYESISDLAGSGATYAVNLWRSSFHYTTLKAFNENDVPEDSVEFVLLSFDKQIPALAAGTVDVIGLMQPYQNYADLEYGDEFRVLFNDYEAAFDESSRHVSLIFVNRIWASNNPEQAKAFVAGVVDAINWIEENQDDAREIIAEATGIPAEAVPDYHFTPDGEIRMGDIAYWLDYLKSRGDVEADWITPGHVGTDAYGVE